MTVAAVYIRLNICLNAAFAFFFIEVSLDLSQAPSEEPEPEHPSFLNPVLDTPEFPDFESSEMETAEGEAVNIAALELEALDLVGTGVQTAVDFGVISGVGPQSDLSASDLGEASESCIIQDLNIGNLNITPLDPASFPEPINLSEFPEAAVPEQWSQSEDVPADCFPIAHSEETDLGAAECQPVPEETELSSLATSDSRIQTHSGLVTAATGIHFGVDVSAL